MSLRINELDLVCQVMEEVKPGDSKCHIFLFYLFDKKYCCIYEFNLAIKHWLRVSRPKVQILSLGWNELENFWIWKNIRPIFFRVIFFGSVPFFSFAFFWGVFYLPRQVSTSLSTNSNEQHSILLKQNENQSLVFSLISLTVIDINHNIVIKPLFIFWTVSCFGDTVVEGTLYRTTVAVHCVTVGEVTSSSFLPFMVPSIINCPWAKTETAGQ